MAIKNTGAGAATAAGITFQENVAAWLVCQIFAGPNRTEDLELPADTLIESLACESLEPIDDIVVRASDRTLYFQCKTTLAIGENREFIKVVQQFTEQFLKPGSCEDRYVLAVSDKASIVVRTALRQAIKSLRGKRGGERELELENHSTVSPKYKTLETTVRDQLQLLQRGKTVDDSQALSLIDRIMIYAAPFGAGACSPDAAIDKLAVGLTRPEDAKRAWEHIVSIVRGFSPHRTGGNRETFVFHLRNAGYITRPLAKVREAIAALQARSRDYLARLERHTLIKIANGSSAKIARPIVDQIYDELKDGSLLLCGEAGAGKTGCLVQAARLLEQKGVPLLVLPVEQILLGADPQSSIGIPAGVSLQEVLQGWQTDKSGVLCLDGLDAARSSVSLKSVLDFVHQLRTVAPDWNVLASIRVFDLEKSAEIRRMFRGTVSDAIHSSLVSDVRAILVPELTDAEIGQLYRDVPDLQEVLAEEAAIGLRSLAKNIFNLDLLVDMLSSHADMRELQQIDTQDQLLETYWSLRIGNDPSRIIPLTELTRIMVKERRLAVHVTMELTSRLTELFSNSVLTLEPSVLIEDPELVRYRHNILFDYAVSRIWLRGLNDQDVLEELARSSELALVFRPSLRMTLQRLWRKAPMREEFWNRVVNWFKNPAMTDIAKLSVHQVVSEEFRVIEDVAMLLGDRDDPVNAGLLEGVVKGALMQRQVDREAFNIVGPNAASWLRLIEMLAEYDAVRFSYSIRNVLVALLHNGPTPREVLTHEQKSTFTSIACKLLNAYIADERTEVVSRELLGVAIQACICAASWDGVTPIESLRCTLMPDYLAKAGFVVLPLLGEAIVALADVNEEFAELVIRAYIECPTPVGNRITSFGGPIFSLTSPASQELSMFEYSVGNVFDELARAHPKLAARAMNLLINQHWICQERKWTGAPDARTTNFEFEGASRVFIRDYSHIWDSSRSYRDHDLWRKAADTVFSILGDDTTSEGIRQALFNSVLAEADLGAIWSRLFHVSAKSPDCSSERLGPLLTETLFLRAFETRHAVGKFLEHRFETWNKELRERIESAIMQVGRETQDFRDDAAHSAEKSRDSLISCLPASCIVTDEVRSLSSLIRLNQSAIPPRSPSNRVKSGFVSEEDQLRERGFLETEAQRDLFELQREIKRLSRSTESLTAEEVPKVMQIISAYERALVSSESIRVASDRTVYAEGEIAAVFSNLAKVEGAKSTDREVILHRLLEFASHTEPTPHVEDDAGWDGETPYWGGPLPRIEAAWGLMRFVRHANSIDKSTRTAILRLVEDPAPAVRFPTIVESGGLYKIAPDLFWQVIEDRVESEVKLALLQNVVEILNSFAPKSAFANRVDQLIRKIESRVADRKDAGFVRAAMVLHHIQRWIYIGDNDAKNWLKRVVNSSFETPEELNQLLRIWEEILSNPQATQIMSAEEIISHGIQALLCAFDVSFAEWVKRPWEGLDQHEAKSEYHRAIGPMQSVVETTSLLLDGRSHPMHPAPREAYEKISGVVKNFRPLIEKCATVPIASDAYSFLRTLQFISPVVPADAILWVRTLVRSAAPEGFLRDSMGADFLVDLLERYLVEHRDLVSDNPETRDAVTDLLNDCVHYGWPKAGPLLVRLHEVFRA